MKEIKPLKRAEELISLSKDHHHALLLCWKIKMGISKLIAPNRIAAYTIWFYKNHLKQHFEIEEKYVFTLFDKTDPNLLIALHDHYSLKSFFEDELSFETLIKFAEALEIHIRFEERVLFNSIQVAGKLQKGMLAFHEAEEFVDNETDLFWK
ncbi:MAG: hemerythrin domain-containing protein [Bacteroidetes bacterium]|nr:hemerythrin domain-containing protein [Bacteroidota bacterium]